jgi:hypothetical protein
VVVFVLSDGHNAAGGSDRLRWLLLIMTSFQNEIAIAYIGTRGKTPLGDVAVDIEQAEGVGAQATHRPDSTLAVQKGLAVFRHEFSRIAKEATGRCPHPTGVLPLGLCGESVTRSLGEIGGYNYLSAVALRLNVEAPLRIR